MNKKDQIHIKFMQRCIDLAMKGLGLTYPNPLVGSVIVYKGTIIGEGWHQKKGTPHAEVNAIHTVKDKSILKECTLYVNLEPCNHYGSTPPCSDLIIKHKIPKVVIGCQDPFDLVNGTGIEKLKKAGVEVIVGVLEEEATFLNKRFFTFHLKKRPYIILKWAETKDGFIAPLKENRSKTAPFWLTNESSQTKNHIWRSQEQSILVGIQTIIDDNPSLTTRKVSGNSPLRLVLDPNEKIPLNSEVLIDKYETIVLSFNNKRNLRQVVVTDYKNIYTEICQLLYRKEIQSIIIEGGTKTLQGFIDYRLWDEARIFVSPKQLRKGVSKPKFEYMPQKTELIKNDIVQYYFKTQKLK